MTVTLSDIILSNDQVDENAANDTQIGFFRPIYINDGDVLPTVTPNFSLVDDAGGRFRISNSGTLSVANGALIDYETTASHTIKIRIDDIITGTSVIKEFIISVTDLPEPQIGTAGSERLVGTAGADMIKGFSGNDKLYGMAGDDVLAGGYGKDFLYGGAGKDTFVFDNPVKKGHFDHIADFTSADDTIQISLSALKAYKVKVAKEEVYESLEGTRAGKQKGFFSLDKVFDKGKLGSKFFAKGHAKDTYDFVTYDRKNGNVYLDLDGSGGSKGFVIAKLKPGTYVQADDFVFI
ncbi:hypothetical protein DC522_17335 [Microvirga sp. KLBC 81]|uniref:calcium-binding protein n=1 Tax=Microvirga sp. KLBC 81 TaxID=1862707 RepID=UPI000D5078CB|nr:hypothetical protein [Microvirga sp. KLBC 81]PVE23120.1 hypothetical protein DC522_17335 [Microvirga sp. KLBC 81]